MKNAEEEPSKVLEELGEEIPEEPNIRSEIGHGELKVICRDVRVTVQAYQLGKNSYVRRNEEETRCSVSYEHHRRYHENNRV